MANTFYNVPLRAIANYLGIHVLIEIRGDLHKKAVIAATRQKDITVVTSMLGMLKLIREQIVFHVNMSSYMTCILFIPNKQNVNCLGLQKKQER